MPKEIMNFDGIDEELADLFGRGPVIHDLPLDGHDTKSLVSVSLSSDEGTDKKKKCTLL